LSRKIIQAAKQQTQELGCFVAGTLVHTKEGLRPIEEIKVGDYVLSKPESGVGEPSYQRVSKTYVHEDREVYFVGWQVLDAATNDVTKGAAEGYVVVTGGHPLWVEGIKDRYAEEGDSYARRERFTEIKAWMSVEALYKLAWEAIWLRDAMAFPVVQLADGTKALISFMNPVLQAPERGVGVVFMDYPETFWKENNSYPRIDFTPNGPNMPRDERGRWLEIYLDSLTAPAPNVDPFVMKPFPIVERSGGFLPIRRTVFNIEVENNHTYYVTEAGLWVHNISGIQKVQIPTNPARSIDVYTGVGGEAALKAELAKRADGRGIGILPDISKTSSGGATQLQLA
jgi:hypothetical protein